MLRAAHSEESIPLRKGTWTAEEDQRLTSFIQTYGIWNWNSLPKAAGLLRSGKSCRLRWVNYLRPDIKHGNFSKEEVETILKLQEDMGNRWSQIALRLPGRTDNEIKNFWNCHLKKRQKKLPRSNVVQATKSQKQNNNISEDNVPSLIAPNAPHLEGLEETPMSPELQAPVNFSSASISFNTTHPMVENVAFQEFPVELQNFPEEQLALQPKQNLCDVGRRGNLTQLQDSIHLGTPQIEPGYVGSSSSGSSSEINKNQPTEKHSNSPGLSEELQSIWELPFLADDFQERFPDQPAVDGSVNPCTLDASDDFWLSSFM